MPLIIKIENPAGDSSRLKYYDDGAKEWWEGAYAGFGGVRLNQAFDPREAIFNYQGIGGTGQYGASRVPAAIMGKVQISRYVTDQLNTSQTKSTRGNFQTKRLTMLTEEMKFIPRNWLASINGCTPATVANPRKAFHKTDFQDVADLLRFWAV